MKKKVIVVFTLFVTALASAQYSETIASGRPGQAVGAKTVGKNVFQIQAGVDYLNDLKSFVPNSAFRYAISDWFEINSSIAYDSQIGDMSGLSVGTRINLNDGKNNMPPMGLQVSFGLPVKSLEFSSKVLFNIANSFSDKWSYTINLGSGFDKEFNTRGIYVFNFSYSVNDKIALFVEPYGTVKTSVLLNFDAGIAYLVNKDLQLDFLGGYGINSGEGLMLGVGVSWRFLTKSKAERI